MHTPFARSTSRRTALVAMVTLCTALASVQAQSARDQRDDRDRDQRQDNAFNWSGNLAAGKRALIKNINGSIHVERSSSNRVEISAV